MPSTHRQDQTRSYSVHLANGDRWVRVSLSLAGPFHGGNLVAPSADFRSAVEGADDLATNYQLSNWLSGVTSGALYAFRSLKVERRCVYLSELQAKLGSADMGAVANAAAMAVPLLSGKDSPALDL